jgi:RimJ/RimL family protein N-acetyltransferase
VATRATRLLADWARRELGLTHMEVLPHRENHRSRRVAEKAGFRDTGELRAAPRGPAAATDYAVYAWNAP